MKFSRILIANRGKLYLSLWFFHHQWNNQFGSGFLLSWLSSQTRLSQNFYVSADANGLTGNIFTGRRTEKESLLSHIISCHHATKWLCETPRLISHNPPRLKAHPCGHVKAYRHDGQSGHRWGPIHWSGWDAGDGWTLGVRGMRLCIQTPPGGLACTSP